MKKSKSIMMIGLQNMLQNLNNPLTTILLSVEKLKEGELSKEEHAYLLGLIEKHSYAIKKEIDELCSNFSNLDIKPEIFDHDVDNRPEL